MIKSKKQMFIIIGVFVLTLLLGTTTYAFFNYTRTGSANVVKVGRISFNTEQNTVNLENIFPIDKANINTDTDNVGTVSIHVTGDTTYSEGIEYLVSAVDVNNTYGENNKILPISLDVSYVASENKTIGTSDSYYYDNRGGDNAIYKILSSKVVMENNKILVGYIPKGATGIDGTITIKSYLDKDIIAISDTYPENTKRIVNPNMAEDEVDDCVNYLTSKHYFGNNSDLDDFCRGTIAKSGYTFQQRLDRNNFSSTYLTYFIEHNIVQEVYSDETTDEWVNGRVVLTTDEWNNLNTNGLSFKVKVEANEGIWADYPENSMNRFPKDVFVRYGVSNMVKEINFNRMNSEEMHQRYAAATIKADLTYNYEGEVLTWLETNNEDELYTMYVASDGITVLNTANDNLFYDVGLIYPVKIEFNNVNTSRITDMSNLFYSQYNLKNIDVTSFDTSNVINFYAFVYGADGVETVNMTGLDLRKAQKMDSMFYGNNSLKEVNMSGCQTRDVTTMFNMFFNSNNIENINIEGLGGDNLESMSTFLGGNNYQLKNINMKNFNFGKMTKIEQLLYDLNELETIDLSGSKMPNVTDAYGLFEYNRNMVSVNLSNIYAPNLQNLSYMFYGCYSLTNIDLSSLNTSSVTNMDSMFYDCKGLTSINLENFDTSSVVTMYSMFGGCTSLVNLDLSNFSMVNVGNCQNMFSGCTSLKTIDLSGVTTIKSAYNLFNNVSALETIYVSNEFDFTNQPDNMPIFSGCTALVGGNNTHYDSSKIDKNMAVIDNNDHEGYLTLKTN